MNAVTDPSQNRHRAQKRLIVCHLLPGSISTKPSASARSGSWRSSRSARAATSWGLGAIRDSIADHLFPGTSTIQTRLRYMLFIPWLFRMLEKPRMFPRRQLRTEARALEIRLADALKSGGESNGIIGRDAGPRLQRLPSSVYWAGLGAWGIRRLSRLRSIVCSSHCAGSRRSRGASRRRRRRWPARRRQPSGTQALPQMPKDLLERAVFRLTADEAQFIIDRLVASQPAALLTMLAREGIDADCDYIWTHPHLVGVSGAARRLVHHGEIFSHVMHGAALLYNLALSELRGRDDWADGLSRATCKPGATNSISAPSARGRSMISGTPWSIRRTPSALQPSAS